ncbi:MAG: DUF58 domain-containing protein [Planctomycetota bacterium]
MSDPLDELLPSLLDLPLRPPSIRLDERGRRGTAREFGEFRGHVPYSEGEDLRFLDWSVLARSGQKVLRRFDAEEHQRTVLILDLSASMRARLAGLQRLSRLYGYLALIHFDSVELILLEESGPRVASFAGADSYPRLETCLEELEPGGDRGLLDLAGVLEQRGRRQGRVLLSDFQPEESCLRTLRSLAELGHRLLCVFPRLAFEEAGSSGAEQRRGPLLLRDPETGEALELLLSDELMRAFREEQEAWERRMDLACRELGDEFRPATLPEAEELGRVEAWLPFLGRAQPSVVGRR